MAKGQIKQKQDNINQQTFEGLCAIQCTEQEICSVLNITDKTLTAWCKSTYGKGFSEIYKEKREMGKSSLRRMQWKLAEKSYAMAIFLGKQYLGQKDVVENQVTSNGILDELKDALNNAKNNQ